MIRHTRSLGIRIVVPLLLASGAPVASMAAAGVSAGGPIGEIALANSGEPGDGQGREDFGVHCATLADSPLTGITENGASPTAADQPDSTMAGSPVGGPQGPIQEAPEPIPKKRKPPPSQSHKGHESGDGQHGKKHTPPSQPHMGHESGVHGQHGRDSSGFGTSSGLGGKSEIPEKEGKSNAPENGGQ
jgi:hypothetical protein